MRKISLLLGITITVMFMNSCKKVDKDGLTDEIKNIVPDKILTEIKSLGMPIYGGDNPPNIENSYLASPFVLVNSNIDYDTPGYQYSDHYMKFYDQNNKKLTISMSYREGSETGDGIGSYIVGDHGKFSVFVEVDAKANDGSTAKLVHIISGEMSDEGIVDLYFANFMINNYGNETGYWIENGKGRVIYDSDGLSPVTDNFKSLTIPSGKSSAAK